MHDMGISADLFPALRATDLEGHIAAHANVQRAHEERAVAEELWSEFLNRDRDTRRAIGQAEQALRALDAVGERLAADRGAYDALEAKAAALPKLKEELVCLNPQRADGHATRLSLLGLQLRLQGNSVTLEHCDTLKAKARAVDVEGIGRLIQAHDKDVPGEIERFKQVWQEKQTAEAETNRDAAVLALEQWRATRQGWFWQRPAWNRELKRHEDALGAATEAVVSQQAELMAESGQRRLAAAVTEKRTGLDAARTALLNKLASAQTMTQSWKDAEAHLAEKERWLRERGALQERLAVIEIAEKQAQAVEAQIRAIEEAMAERARLAAEIESAENILCVRGESEHKLVELQKQMQALKADARALALRRRNAVSMAAVAEGALELIGSVGGDNPGREAT
jgi:hypothetical protein